jgi:hypothetical protein
LVEFEGDAMTIDKIKNKLIKNVESDGRELTLTFETGERIMLIADTGGFVIRNLAPVKPSPLKVVEMEPWLYSVMTGRKYKILLENRRKKRRGQSVRKSA